MFEVKFPLKPNEIVTTAFGNELFCVSNSIVEIHFLDKGKSEILRTNQKIAEIYWNFEVQLFKINPSLKFHYLNDNENVVFYKGISNNYKPENYKKVLWFWFQKTNLKIQLLSHYSNELAKFYRLNKEEFISAYHMEDSKIESVLAGDLNSDRTQINKINRYNSSNNYQWINFSFFDLEPLELTFNFLKTLPIIQA